MRRTIQKLNQLSVGRSLALDAPSRTRGDPRLPPAARGPRMQAERMGKPRIPRATAPRTLFSKAPPVPLSISGAQNRDATPTRHRICSTPLTPGPPSQQAQCRPAPLGDCPSPRDSRCTEPVTNGRQRPSQPMLPPREPAVRGSAGDLASTAGCFLHSLYIRDLVWPSRQPWEGGPSRAA